MSEEPAGAPLRRRTLKRLSEFPVSVLERVTERRAAALSEIGIDSVLDLLTYYPRDWSDYRHVRPIGELADGDEAIVRGRVEKVTTRRPRGRRPIVEARFADETGVLVCTFFNQSWRQRQLVVGSEFGIIGKIEWRRGRPEMTNPIVDSAGTQIGRVVPVYRQSEKAGVSSPDLARYVEEALERAGPFEDPLEDHLRGELDVLDRTTAFRWIHYPPEPGGHFAARRRLAFDELLRLQLRLVSRKRLAARQARGIPHQLVRPDGSSLVALFLSHLPFSLTDAQRHVLAEIAADLASPLPMHRLLQGDVGSGKTVVALASLLYGVQGGYETALMVPTEVLAEQHYFAARQLLQALEVEDARRLLGRRPLRVELLTARTTASERERTLRALAHGEVDILVGTHALLTDDVRFASLGVVVIDEQHRFGVDQRARLREKGAGSADARDPDLLVMTATPIPRTAAMTVYGDLDLSVLDELPAGRTPTSTRWVRNDTEREPMWTVVRAELRAGHQVYVVCPLVRAGEEPEGIDEEGLEMVPDEDEEALGDAGRLFAAPPPPQRRAPLGAVETLERLAAGELAGARLGLLHGQMPPRDKDTVMSSFRAGELQVLVATTVIEVGVDVPNATVMVIEDADRFGIAQLHQLRGRIGRGTHPSVCYLSTGEVGPEAQARLEAVLASTDGFVLAEADLALRGEGTVLGARQKGRNDLKLASLRSDRALIERARAIATELLDDDPRLERHELLADEVRLYLGGEAADYLFRS